MTTALENTEKIRSIFLETQRLFARHQATPALFAALEQVESQFRSIGYESASMAVALKGFAAGTFPGDWLAFADGPAAAHRAQVYVGLGWAIAKSGAAFATTVRETDAKYVSRVADGCGYHDGTFKHSQTVLNHQRPTSLPAELMPAYDQGVGRSLWYSEKTDVERVRSTVEAFAADRQADLWRGVGLAVAYVGGCGETALSALFHAAAAHGAQLIHGAALAVESRTAANTVTDDTRQCSQFWSALVVA